MKQSSVCVLVLILVIACVPAAPTPYPTYTPFPTYTPYPTYTPVRTPMPTSTPVPGTTAKYTVTLHYYNQIKGEEIGDPCSPDAVLPVEREIPATTTPIQDTIRLLIEGNLTEEERVAGFSTEFPHPQFKLLGATLKDGILTLEFADPAHFTVGGSCRVLLLRAQFERTAKQFVEVEEVRFEPEFLFQP